ncbi:response regulator transcription factor [Meiothermus granaticius]|uniref:Response regulator UvrY n=1 Tax=Meiothermus granaticius NBRC 107808 TaxID=1227551 RepID=A0A399FA01_9DEIN|nr:response regulator transcription factor [Meiothermus granaticius]MCL6527117.1 response regulator transcription factor [Thermaceae bacterium]RIH92099.1 Response regulator UvrY [Meiothermus granaticius NBRC 107808]GEM86285.1 DNA-binding response regulator [Meiothermus granaticius NBRC 107808]
MRLLIADDHPLFRLGLRAALEGAGFEVVAEAKDGLQAAEMALKYAPDALLMDLKMPQMDGIAAARKLRQNGYTGIIALLTTFSEPALIAEAARAGADAYWSKEVPPEALAARLQRLKGGQEPRLTPPPMPSLTPREAEVLAQLATGLSTKEIARNLSLSPETVKDYLDRLYAKLEARNRVEALERARGLGLL